MDFFGFFLLLGEGSSLKVLISPFVIEARGPQSSGRMAEVAIVGTSTAYDPPQTLPECCNYRAVGVSWGMWGLR